MRYSYIGGKIVVTHLMLRARNIRIVRLYIGCWYLIYPFLVFAQERNFGTRFPGYSESCDILSRYAESRAVVRFMWRRCVIFVVCRHYMYNIARRLIYMSVTMFLSRPVGGLFQLLLQFFILARASPIRQSHPHSAIYVRTIFIYSLVWHIYWRPSIYYAPCPPFYLLTCLSRQGPAAGVFFTSTMKVSSGSHTSLAYLKCKFGGNVLVVQYMFPFWIRANACVHASIVFWVVLLSVICDIFYRGRRLVGGGV